jgi:NADPH2:quinone reductase
VHVHLVDLLRAGKIRPIVGEVVSFDRLPEALEKMEARSTMGRVVVQIGS